MSLAVRHTGPCHCSFWAFHSTSSGKGQWMPRTITGVLGWRVLGLKSASEMPILGAPRPLIECIESPGLSSRHA